MPRLSRRITEAADRIGERPSLKLDNVAYFSTDAAEKIAASNQGEAIVSERLRGELVRKLEDKNYGFIKVHDGRQKDLFVHARAFKGGVNAWLSVETDDLLEFMEEQEESGRLRAIDVTLVDESVPVEVIEPTPKGYVGRSFGRDATP